jgi:hypothetical protein
MLISGPVRKGGSFIRIAAAVLLISAYPAFIVGYTWSHVVRANLPGGRHGPLDAYLHTLASAVVSFTLGPRVVRWATAILERGRKRSNLMDQHNNRIGAAIGARVAAFSEIEPAVRAEVLRGTIHAADPMQVTWLPPERWRAGRLW